MGEIVLIVAFLHIVLPINCLIWLANRRERQLIERLSKETLVRVANSRGVW
jgi:hypothetical protein